MPILREVVICHNTSSRKFKLYNNSKSVHKINTNQQNMSNNTDIISSNSFFWVTHNTTSGYGRVNAIPWERLSSARSIGIVDHGIVTHLKFRVESNNKGCFDDITIGAYATYDDAVKNMKRLLQEMDTYCRCRVASASFDDLRSKVETLWYAPNAPGQAEAKEHYETFVQLTK
jgi:hypothetical protein